MSMLHKSTYGRRLKAEQAKRAQTRRRKEAAVIDAKSTWIVDEQVRCARTLHVPREHPFECYLILCPRTKTTQDLDALVLAICN